MTYSIYCVRKIIIRLCQCEEVSSTWVWTCSSLKSINCVSLQVDEEEVSAASHWSSIFLWFLMMIFPEDGPVAMHSSWWRGFEHNEWDLIYVTHSVCHECVCFHFPAPNNKYYIVKSCNFASISTVDQKKKKRAKVHVHPATDITTRTTRSAFAFSWAGQLWMWRPHRSVWSG